MTNSSVKSSFAVLFVGVLTIALTSGVFVSIAHAQEMSLDFAGDNGGSLDFAGNNGGSLDFAGNNGGSLDFAGDNSGALDFAGNNGGALDFAGDNGGALDFAGDNGGALDFAGEEGFYEEYYDEMCDCSHSSPSFGGQSFGGSSYRPVSFGFPSAPTTFYAPSYRPQNYTAPRQSSPSITNINNNTNVNNNVNNNSAVAIATVAAAPVQYQVQYVQPQPVYQHPYCTITLTNYNGGNYGPYSNNQLATLTWSSSGATSGYISPNVGNVSGYGSMQVYPTSGMIYSMTVYGQGGTATCQTQQYYIPVAPVTPTPYVSLSQIPYTGFDFGALGNAIYWLSLMVFAGAAAYLVLYFNGGALAVIGGSRSKRTDVAMPKITVSHAPAHVAKEVEKPVVSPIQIASTENRNTETNTSDTMHITHSKSGSMPQIQISRE